MVPLISSYDALWISYFMEFDYSWMLLRWLIFKFDNYFNGFIFIIMLEALLNLVFFYWLTTALSSGVKFLTYMQLEEEVFFFELDVSGGVTLQPFVFVTAILPNVQHYFFLFLQKWKIDKLWKTGWFRDVYKTNHGPSKGNHDPTKVRLTWGDQQHANHKYRAQWLLFPLCLSWSHKWGTYMSYPCHHLLISHLTLHSLFLLFLSSLFSPSHSLT